MRVVEPGRTQELEPQGKCFTTAHSIPQTKKWRNTCQGVSWTWGLGQGFWTWPSWHPCLTSGVELEELARKWVFLGRGSSGHILETTDQVHVWARSGRGGGKDKAGCGGGGRTCRGCKGSVLHTTAAEPPLEEHPHPSARRTVPKGQAERRLHHPALSRTEQRLSSSAPRREAVTLAQHLQGQLPLPITPFWAPSIHLAPFFCLKGRLSREVRSKTFITSS